MIYISCNPPTLARDIADLRSRFSIVSITPLDMFPQTAEIEVAVHLRASSVAEAVDLCDKNWPAEQKQNRARQ